VKAMDASSEVEHGDDAEAAEHADGGEQQHP